jgi:hypothetical protein
MTATDVPRLSARVTPGNAGQRREHDSQYPAALLLGGRALAGLPPEHDAEERQVRHHFGVVGWSHLRRDFDGHASPSRAEGPGETGGD